jgi:hypothetical protein
MESYRLVLIRLNDPSTSVKVKDGSLTKGVEPGTNSIFIDLTRDPISMPVGTIFLNYTPDVYCPTVPSFGTLYCLVPDWQFIEKEKNDGK